MPPYIQGQEPNYFGQLLSILSTEELTHLRIRFIQIHDKRMAEVLNDEITERIGIEKEQPTWGKP